MEERLQDKMVLIRILMILMFCSSMGGISEVAKAVARPNKNTKRHAPGAPRDGPWVEEAWRREDWSNAPSVREWGYSAPKYYDTNTGQPSSTAEYPWGYVSPYTVVGGKCITNELNESPGGLVVRYQRVLPIYYCR